MRKIMKKAVRVLAIIVSCLVFLCIVGRSWDYVATKSEQAKYPPMGTMVKPFDSNIHVFSVGEKKENEPTIVLISGAGTPSPVVDFNPLWSRLEKNIMLLYSNVLAMGGASKPIGKERLKILL